MPITSELDNRRKFKAAGFSDQQAEVPVETLERSVQQGFERFVEVFDRGLSDLRTEMNARFASLEQRVDLGRAELRAELHSSLRDQMLKFITILMGVAGVAVAVIKLFPNWY